MNHSFTLKIMAEQEDAWNECEGKKEENLLRLSLLRELSFQLHAEQSRLLASGKKDDAYALKKDENHLDQLRLRDGKECSSEIQKNFPARFLKIIPPEKFERQDREWECAMACEALAIGWNFWTLTSTIRIYDLEAWHHAFQNELWPHGVVLWAENAELNAYAAAASTKQPPTESKEPIWRGTWTLILEPQIKTPKQLKLNLDQLPGAVPGASFDWKQVYAKKIASSPAK